MICRKYLIVSRDFIIDTLLNDKKVFIILLKKIEELLRLKLIVKVFIHTINIFQFGKFHFMKTILSHM